MRALLVVVAISSVTLGCQRKDGSSERTTSTVTAAEGVDAGSPQVLDGNLEPVMESTSGGCSKDSDCPAGQVCEACGARSECAPGCHTDAQCGAGEICEQVQCIRCPCPGQCGAARGR